MYDYMKITNEIHGSSLFEREVNVEPISRRIKLYHLPDQYPVEYTLTYLKKLGRKKHCDKLIFYVNKEEEQYLQSLPLEKEGYIKGFFKGEDAYIYSFFLTPTRKNSITLQQEKKVMDIVQKDSESRSVSLPTGYYMRRATTKDTKQMAALYDTVFETYPTPMNNPDYIKTMMHDDVYFTVVEKDGEIVSASSADVLSKFNAAEMTDCATLEEHRGKRLLSHQFTYLENLMKQKGIQTLFCYARSVSVGMNLINIRHEFTYGGCMVQNSNISGNLESMNIWFKNF